MTVWRVSPGSNNEYRDLFHDQNRIAISYGFDEDLGTVESYDVLKVKLSEKNPDASPSSIGSSAGQLWTLAPNRKDTQDTQDMKAGDAVIMPFRKKIRTISIGKIIGDYKFSSEDPYHFREVQWVAQDIPRSAFSQKFLSALPPHKSVVRITDESAKNLLIDIIERGKFSFSTTPEAVDERAIEGNIAIEDNVEDFAADKIERLISKKFKGYDMERLVEAVLKAQGYTVYHSPKGPDKGVDLLAAPGPLGFGTPRICVQVKSGSSPTDRPTLDQLIGTMQNVQADQGLFVSWGGFNQEVKRAVASQFFKVRLWDHAALIDQVLEHYDELDSDIKTELPLKRIWTVIPEQEE